MPPLPKYGAGRRWFARMRHVVVMGCLLLVLPDAVMAQTPADTGLKSNATALKYSLWGTIAPIVGGGVIYAVFPNKDDNYWQDRALLVSGSLAGAGVLFGPGLGHAYAGNKVRLVTGALLRILPMGIYAAALGVSASFGDGEVDATVVLPLSLVTASVVYDIATTGQSVTQYNHRHALTLTGVSYTLGSTGGRITLLISIY